MGSGVRIRNLSSGGVMASRASHVLIDCSRLGVYATQIRRHAGEFDLALLGSAVLAAFLGAYLGNRHLKKATLPGIQRTVAVLLVLVALGLMAGWL